MDCHAVETELVAYLKGELGSECAARVEHHLAQCETCREECARLQTTFHVLDESITPVELSADFRMNLMGRLYDAVEEEEEAVRQAVRAHRHPSSVRLLAPELPWTQQLWQQMRRSPYVAASFALHAAALLMIGVLIGLQVRPQPQRVHTEIQEAQPVSPEEYTDHYVFSCRQKATRISTPVMVLDDGALDVDIGRLRHSGTLVLQQESGVCLRAYFADEPGLPSQQDLLAMYPKASVASVEKGHVVLPPAVQLPDMAKASDMLVLALDNRLEFWQQVRWDEYEGTYMVLAISVAPQQNTPCDAWASRRRISVVCAG